MLPTIYYLHVTGIDSSISTIWGDREAIKGALDKLDHEGSSIVLLECKEIEKPYEFLGKV